MKAMLGQYPKINRRTDKDYMSMYHFVHIKYDLILYAKFPETADYIILFL